MLPALSTRCMGSNIGPRTSSSRICVVGASLIKAIQALTFASVLPVLSLSLEHARPVYLLANSAKFLAGSGAVHECTIVEEYRYRLPVNSDIVCGSDLP